MRIAFYGSSLLSSVWNGAATYYRGLVKALARRGHDIVFYEPDAFGRQQRRDIEPPDWCRVIVWPATETGLAAVLAEAPAADVIIKASGVGVFDDALVDGVLRHAAPEALAVYWDVDAPATLAEMAGGPDHPLRRVLPRFDMVMTYGGGLPVVEAYRRFGAPACHTIYNALDPEDHFPVPPDPRFAGDLGFLGNRLPDREARVEAFFLEPAARAPELGFLLGGSGWEAWSLPANVRWLDHVPTRDHNAFNVTPRAVLNVTRDSMARNGWSPPTRLFEAVGAGACLITDAWEGIEDFLAPDEEVLVARDGADVVAHLRALDPGRAAAIGRRGRARLLRAHTYDRRAATVEHLLAEALARKSEASAA